jgi:two-component system response regulator YesN
VDDRQLEVTLTRSADHLRRARKTSAPKQPLANPIIERAKNYIYEHISQDISRDDLAGYLGFNPSYLSLLFKKETGNTLSDYIKTERIAFAKRLLRQTNLPIGVISENVGYDSLSYFSSVFHQLAGCTPRQYRNKTTSKYSGDEENVLTTPHS